MKKQNKAVTYIKEHKTEIIRDVGGAVIAGAIGAGVGWIFLRTEYGKLYKAMQIFGRGSKTNVSLATGMTNFLNEATSIQLLSPDGAGNTVADLGEDIAKVMVEQCGYNVTDKVTGLMIGIKK